jgi:hypothetical protein
MGGYSPFVLRIGEVCSSCEKTIKKEVESFFKSVLRRLGKADIRSFQEKIFFSHWADEL